MISGASQEIDIQRQKDKNTLAFYNILIKNAHPNAKTSSKLFQLIKAGININARFKSGYTLLHICVVRNNLAWAQELVRLGADVNTKTNRYRSTPLHRAVLNRNFKMAELLLGAQAEINAQNRDNNTPLHIALERGETSIAQLLLHCGAKINIKGIYGNTVLFTAIDRGQIEIIQYLLQNKVNLDVKSDAGNTALHIALVEGPKIAQLLLEHGANINFLNNQGNSPLKMAFLVHYDQFEATAATRLITGNFIVFINKILEAGWGRFDILRESLGPDFSHVNTAAEMAKNILGQDRARILDIIRKIEAQYSNAAILAPASLLERLAKVLEHSPVEVCAPSSSFSQVFRAEEQAYVTAHPVTISDEMNTNAEENRGKRSRIGR